MIKRSLFDGTIVSKANCGASRCLCGSTSESSHSEFKCSIALIILHPVTKRGAAFSTVFSLFKDVLLAAWDQAGLQ